MTYAWLLLGSTEPRGCPPPRVRCTRSAMTASDTRPMTLVDARALLAQSRDVADMSFAGLDLRRAVSDSPGAIPRTFQRCDFRECSLAGLDLTGVTFDCCVFDEADISGADLENSSWLAGSGLKLQAVGARANGARFERCTMIGADWSQASLAGARFKGVRLAGASFARARLRDTSFEDCQLIAADMRNISFHRQTLRHVDFSDANLAGSDLRDATLDGCRLRGVKLTGAQCAGADLRGSDLGALAAADCIALRGAIISPEQAGEIVRGLGLLVRG